MARRKELRYLTIGFQDGFEGTGAINETTPAVDDTVTGIDTLVLHDSAKIVNIGDRFTTAGITTVRSVTASQNSMQWTLDMTAPTAGTFTVTIDGQVTSGLAFDIAASALQTALEGLSTVGTGNVTVTEATSVHTITMAGTKANTAGIVLTVDGSGLTAVDSHVLTALQDGTTTWEVTFTPAYVTGAVPSNDDAITFYPKRLEINVGEGNATHTENKDPQIDLNRGLIDGARAGNEQPMEFASEFVYDWLRASSGNEVTPYEVLNQLGEGANWHTTADDPCEPFCIDVFILDAPPCGSEQVEMIFFRKFNLQSMTSSVEGANVTFNGICTAQKPDIYRIDNDPDDYGIQK
jgi:hypothetical protein